MPLLIGIIKRIENMSRWIKRGIPVVHITNLDKEFTVDHIIFKSKRIEKEDGTSFNVSRIIGVELNSINSDGKIEKTVVHSKELIPAEIAVRGKLEAYRFINREGEYKNWEQ